jgi:hypothetical protein
MAMTSRSAVFAHGRAMTTTTTMRTRTRTTATMRRSAMTLAAIPVHIEVRFVEGDARIWVDDVPITTACFYCIRRRGD